MPYNLPTVQAKGFLVDSFFGQDSGFLGETYFPLNTSKQTDSEIIKFYQSATLKGMTKGRNLGSTRRRIAPPGMTLKTCQTAYWGEDHHIDEVDLVRLADVAVDDRMLAENKLYARRSLFAMVRLRRLMEYLRWKAADNGFSSGLTVDDQTITIDFGHAAAASASVAWGTYASSNPVADLVALLQSFRGTGATWVDFVMNQAAASKIARSANFIDMMKFNNIFRTGINSIGETVKDLVNGSGEGVIGGARLRNVYVYDNTYVDDNGATQTYIADTRVFAFGGVDSPMAGAEAPENDIVGQFLSTPALQADGRVRPGIYLMDFDRRNQEEQDILIRCGVHGLPIVFNSQWIKRLNTLS